MLKNIFFLSLLSASVIGHAAPLHDVTLDQTGLSSEATIKQPVVAYFSNSEDDFSYSPRATAGGFYRILLGRDPHGNFLVQDFFTDSDKKQTDPYWITEVEGLASFDLNYIDGSIQGYYSNGKTAFKGVLDHGEFASKYDSFYMTGELANSYTPLKNGHFSDVYFYPNGQKALEIEYDDEGEISHQKGWDKSNNSFDDENAISELQDQINQQLYIDQ